MPVSKKTFAHENITNFTAYQNEHGDERAKGYLDAMTDMVSHIDSILTGVHTHPVGYVPTQPARVRSLLTKFEREKRELVEQIKKQNFSIFPNNKKGYKSE